MIKKDVMDVSYFHKIQIFIIHVLIQFSVTKEENYSWMVVTIIGWVEV